MKFKNTKEDGKFEYLQKNVFHGLENLNNGFDSERIFYFSEFDFQTVINRVEKLKIGILGIEPWLNDKFYDVKTYGEYNLSPKDPKWYKKAFEEFKEEKKNLKYAATYKM
jgi:hypothetical protein